MNSKKNPYECLIMKILVYGIYESTAMAICLAISIYGFKMVCRGDFFEIMLIIMASLAFYSFKIEPFRLLVNRINLSENQSNSLKLVQFSDTHIKPDFTAKNFQKVVDLINQQDPDIVVFTGDLVYMTTPKNIQTMKT